MSEPSAEECELGGMFGLSKLMGAESEGDKTVNDAQLLSVKMIEWANGKISDMELMSELLPVIIVLEARVARLEQRKLK